MAVAQTLRMGSWVCGGNFRLLIEEALGMA